jgi:hypothetical protein
MDYRRGYWDSENDITVASDLYDNMYAQSTVLEQLLDCEKL